jgi:penicillin-binding protein 2
VVLTIDMRLQRVAEKAFGDRPRRDGRDRAGHGAVLALVSKPGFDLNLFVDGPDPQYWAELNTNPDRPLNNRAIAGVYPPGSTFKPFMALAALELGKRTPRSQINDPGYFIFGDRRFRDSKPGGHGVVDLHKSIVVSSDTVLLPARERHGHRRDRRVHEAARPRREDRHRPERRGRRHPALAGVEAGAIQAPRAAEVVPGRDHLDRHRPGLQRLYAGAARAGDGDRGRERRDVPAARGRHVANPRTGERSSAEPELVRQVPLKREWVDFVKRAMAGVNIEGTGARAFARAGYTSGGKTGTAQVIAMKQNEKYDEKKIDERHRDHSLFIAFAPLDNPIIAMLCIVENGGFGARAAAPIARTVFDYYLLGKMPAALQAAEHEVEDDREGD